jgi:HisA/HisF family protein
MLVLPVLDILAGNAVHALAGRRNEYRPIVSRLTPNHDPLAIANAIRKEFGLNALYLADLDGIAGRLPDLDLFRRLTADGFQLLIDAGVGRRQEAQAISELPGANVVVGLETCHSPDDLANITSKTCAVTFSLDLYRGAPRRQHDSTGWSDQPDAIARQAVEANASAIIVLDLADVGMSTGGSSDLLCRKIRLNFPGIGLIAGGGVRGPIDLVRLDDLKVDAVLVASALHSGHLIRGDLQPWNQNSRLRSLVNR